MPAATLRPPAAAIVKTILHDWVSIPPSQGVEGRRVEEAAREAATHWQARPSCALAMSELEDLYSYESIPLKVVGTARVKYRLAGRLQPSPYPSDR